MPRLDPDLPFSDLRAEARREKEMPADAQTGWGRFPCGPTCFHDSPGSWDEHPYFTEEDAEGDLP